MHGHVVRIERSENDRERVCERGEREESKGSALGFNLSNSNPTRSDKSDEIIVTNFELPLQIKT